MKKKVKWFGFLCMGLASLLPWHIGAAADAPNWQGGVPEYQEVQGKITQDGPKLVFSDSPEMVKECGIMYRDTVQGPVRLFFHHVNDMKTDKRLAVVLRRVSLRPSSVLVGKNGVSRPNTDWLEAGKEAQERYYGSVPSRKPFAVLGVKDLLGSGKGLVVKPQQLVTGIVDLETDQPVEVSVLMMPMNADLKISTDLFSILPLDEGGHVLRGTFNTSNCHVTLEEPFDADKNTIWGLELADNAKNPYVTGVDATTGQKVINYGNYGVMYDVNFRTKGKRNTILRFNPYGGPYAGEGVLDVQDKAAKYIRLPEDATSFGWSGDGENMVVGTIPADRRATFHFSPPGSSNLPIRLFWQGEEKNDFRNRFNGK